MARIHPEVNNRGLTIYNPYFEATKINAVYLLFHNPEPKLLLDGIRKLNINGAIAAGFEKKEGLLNLVDELTPLSQKLRRVGIIINDNGKLIGHYQGGYGLVESIRSKIGIENKKIVIMGAGVVTRGFLWQLLEDGIKLSSVEIYNRTVANAEKVATEFNDLNIKVGKLDELKNSPGDIFINATDIGSPWNDGEDYVFSEEFVKKFKLIADVTFVPLKPQLIEVAEKAGVPNSPGWRMFLYQGQMCLEKILKIKVDLTILGKLIQKDFKTNWS